MSQFGKFREDFLDFLAASEKKFSRCSTSTVFGDANFYVIGVKASVKKIALPLSFVLLDHTE